MKKKPNLLFVGIDSLRRDRMSLHGYHRLTTPHLDKYAQSGAVWNSCFSASIPTTSGYANMLSGHDVFGTGIVGLRHKGSYATGVKTLPEILRENGYTTSCVGFTGNPASRGFDKYIDFSGWGSWEAGRSRKAENLNEAALPELRRLAAGNEPFLLFLRHMDPHSPYLPPQPFERIFYAGDEYDAKNKSLEKCYAFKPFCDYFYSWFPPGCTDVEYIKAQYDGEVAYMDACIAIITEELKTLGLEDDTVVIFTSDHGETLDEHECWFDHHGLYECTLSVPLVFRYPAKIPAGSRFDDIVTLKDVLPTVLDIMDIDRKDIPMDGRSLLPRMTGGSLEQEPEFYITECTWERKHGWRTPQYKLIRALEPDLHYKSEVELYDLIKDPLELDNIAEKEPGIVKALSDRMDNWIKKREKETGRTAPIVNEIHWHGFEDRGPFKSSDEAYNSMHIGDTKAAQKLQAALKKETN
ncbi:MAG: sulfatase-like hydrolase/transferase [Treponema sp.]|jgi:arylsulfatase A-like enzyme|nr:sulfatase-like hydrolase/transferase [Treponema sp.]